MRCAVCALLAEIPRPAQLTPYRLANCFKTLEIDIRSGCNTSLTSNIEKLGWTEEFANSLRDGDKTSDSQLARVVSENRRGIVVDDGIQEQSVSSQGRWFHSTDDQRPIVGDWVLLSTRDGNILRVLDRRNKLQRVSKRSSSPQAIASNVDIMFIVFSCDGAFNESRLERYLALGENIRHKPCRCLDEDRLAQRLFSIR